VAETTQRRVRVARQPYDLRRDRVEAAESRVRALRQFAGRWVAMKDEDVVIAAASPGEVVGWLSEHGVRADSMFRVPEDELAASGLAPW